MTVYVDALPLCDEKRSGIGHLTLEMVKSISARDDLDVTLLVPLGKKRNLKRLGIDKAKVRTIPLPARVLSILSQSKLMPPIDILLGRAVYLFPNYRNWPLLRSPSFTYFHDASFALYPETVSPKNLRYLKRNASLWLRRASGVLTLSDSSKRDLTKVLGVQDKKIGVIGCGVDISHYYRRRKAEIEQAKSIYGLDVGEYILYVGNFEPRKNIDRLLDAYAALPPSLKRDYALVLIGGGGWLNNHTMQHIDSLVASGENIARPNSYVNDKDLPAIYSGASLLIHPALYEGFGLSLLQAMACGVPVIAANNSSLVEVVGGAGVLVDAHNDAAISAKIRLVLTNKSLREGMRMRGIKQAKKYSWADAAEKLVRFIHKTLNQSSLRVEVGVDKHHVIQ